MRRLFLFTLLGALCLSCLIVPSALAETVTLDGIVYELRDGHACLAGFAEGAESVTLHPTINGYPVDYFSEEEELPGGKAVKQVAFAEGTTTSDFNEAGYAGLLFEAMSAERILIPSTLTSLDVTSFFGLTSLKEFQVAKDNPAYCVIDGALYSKDGMELLLFPADMAGAYTLPSGVICIKENAFQLSKRLTQLTIPEGVTEIADYAFAGAEGLTELALPSSLVKIGGNALPSAGSLLNIKVTEENEEYESVGGVLYSKNLKKLIAFPCGRGGHYDIPPGTSVIAEDAFGYNRCLESIYVPEGIAVLSNYTLLLAEGLEQISLPASLTFIGNAALPGDGALTQITVAKDNANFQSYDGVLFSRDGKTLIRYPSGRDGAYEIPPGTLYIDQDAFRNCDGLTSVTVPDGVTALPNYLLSGASSLEEIFLPASLKEIGEGVLPVYGKLRRVEIDEKNQRYRSIDGVVFEGEELIFYPSCHGLSYDIPPGIKSIRNQAFAECEMLQTISIPRGVTVIGESMFYRCTSLERVSLPITLTQIGMGAFGNCIALSSITLPPGLEILDAYAFDNCASLSLIQIPDGVKVLDRSVFQDHSPGFVLYALKGSAGYWHAWEYDILWAEPGGVPGFVKPAERQTQSAVVNNASNQESMDLFTKPSAGAKSLGKYVNGTTVQVIDAKVDWAHVQLYGTDGYMPLESLMFTDKFNDLVRITWGRKRKDMTDPLRLYAKPSEEAPAEAVTEDVSMRILDTEGVWYHVLLQGREGYVPVQHLNAATSQPQNYEDAATDYYVVANPKSSDRLHLRKEPSTKSPSLGRYFNGTQVEVIDYSPDGWAHVRVDGKEGYMMIQYLLPIYWDGERSLWTEG
jgi:uncharacterized protein YgiM (DUF1202 family)